MEDRERNIINKSFIILDNCNLCRDFKGNEIVLNMKLTTEIDCSVLFCFWLI